MHFRAWSSEDEALAGWHQRSGPMAGARDRIKLQQGTVGLWVKWGITDVIRWQKALRRPRYDTFHVCRSSSLPAKRGEDRGQAAPGRIATSARGAASTRGVGRAPTTSDHPPRREAVLDGLARGEDHVVVFLKDDDF